MSIAIIEILGLKIQLQLYKYANILGTTTSISNVSKMHPQNTVDKQYQILKQMHSQEHLTYTLAQAKKKSKQLWHANNMSWSTTNKGQQN